MHFLFYVVLEVMPPSSLVVSEGDSAHLCVSLKGVLRESVQILIETGDENAIGMFSKINMHIATVIFNATCYYFSQLRLHPSELHSHIWAFPPVRTVS